MWIPRSAVVGPLRRSSLQLSLRLCVSCGVGRPEDTPSACYACGSSDRIVARSLQGRRACFKGYGMMKKGAKVGVSCFMTAAVFAGQCFSATSGVGNLLTEDPDVIGFLGNVGKVNHWWEAKGGLGRFEFLEEL